VKLNIKNNILKYITRKIGGQKYLSIQIDITNACNLSCTHCYHSHHKNKGALSLNQWKQVLSQYKYLLNKLHLEPSITICGGEPTISPLFIPILDYIKHNFDNSRVNVLSNGVTITDAFINKTKNYNLNYQISLDGPDAKRHDLIRGKGNFDKAINGIKILKKNNIPVNLLAILSKKTSTWLEDFYKTADQLNVNFMNFTRFIPVGYGKSLKQSGNDDVLLGLGLKHALEKIVHYSKSYNVGTNTNEPLYHLIDESLGQHGKFGFQGLVVDYKGFLKVSSRTDVSLGSVLDEGLENLFFNDPILKNLRKGNIKVCGACPYYKRCGGNRNMSYAITGSFLSADIGCWLNTNQEEKYNEVS